MEVLMISACGRETRYCFRRGSLRNTLRKDWQGNHLRICFKTVSICSSGLSCTEGRSLITAMQMSSRLGIRSMGRSKVQAHNSSSQLSKCWMKHRLGRAANTTYLAWASKKRLPSANPSSTNQSGPPTRIKYNTTNQSLSIRASTFTSNQQGSSSSSSRSGTANTAKRSTNSFKKRTR